jgi:hypothetical protein
MHTAILQCITLPVHTTTAVCNTLAHNVKVYCFHAVNPNCLHAFLSACLPACLFVCLPACLPACLPFICQVIAEHLYREGRFELADQFVCEAGVADAAHLKAPYTALHSVLEQVST